MASVEALLRIPKVPGLYCIQYFGSEYMDFAVLEKFPNGLFRYKQVATNMDPTYALDFCFEMLRNKYRATHQDDDVYDTPVVIVPNATGEADTYELVMLAPGLLVAHSKHYVSTFSREYGRWFLEWVAKDPGHYHMIRLQRGRVLTTLKWDGNGLRGVNVVDPDHQLTRAHPWCNQVLIPHRLAEDNNNIHSLFIGGISETVYCASTGHTHRFVEKAGSWTWEVSHCELEDFQSDCHLADKDLEIMNVPWQIMVKLEEDYDDEEQMSVSSLEDLEAADVSTEDDNADGYDISLCDLFCDE